MAEFATATRRWLESLIKQRRLLIRLNKSHKDPVKEETALSRLSTNLNAYSYNNDLHMARFIRNYQADIDTILPGEGSTSHDKKMIEFKELNIKAIMIISGNIKFKQLETQISK